MSLQNALAFIQALDKDATLKNQLKSYAHGIALEDIVKLAASRGFEFTVDEFRSAFVADWNMRRAYYGGGSLR